MIHELSVLQSELAKAIRHAGYFAQSSKWATFARTELCGSTRLSPVAQLEIYREQFWLRHVGALQEDFPGLVALLSPAHWKRLTNEYLSEVAPDSYTLRDLGLRLPDTIARATWLPHQGLCLDMARLEVAYVEAFDAPDTQPLAPDCVGDLSSERFAECRLVVAPCVRLLSVDYPVAELRRQLAGEKVAVVMPARAAHHLVVYRRRLELWDRTMSDVAFSFLAALAAGHAVAHAAERAAPTPEREAELAAGISDWLRDWSASGLLSQIVVPMLPREAGT